MQNQIDVKIDDNYLIFAFNVIQGIQEKERWEGNLHSLRERKYITLNDLKRACKNYRLPCLVDEGDQDQLIEQHFLNIVDSCGDQQNQEDQAMEGAARQNQEALEDQDAVVLSSQEDLPVEQMKLYFNSYKALYREFQLLNELTMQALQGNGH